MLAKRSPLLRDAIFLIAAHGNLKEVVYNKGSLVRSELQSRGFKTEKLLNLTEPSRLRSTLERVMAEGVLKNTQPLSQQVLFSTGHTLDEFHEHTELLSIFSDDVASALRDSLYKRARELGSSHAKYGFITEALESIAPFTCGRLTVELVSRDKSCLIQGGLSGDCTAPGSFNNWTVGPWVLTYENSQFRFNYQGTFFARVVTTAGYHLGKDGRATTSQWNHAIEFSPLARVSDSGSKLADPELQKELFSDLIAFTSSHAKASGCTSSFLTTVSNSFGFGSILASLVAGENQYISPRPSRESFILPSPLRSAHEIRSMLHREFASTDTPIATYLQGASGRTAYKLSTPIFPQNTVESNKTTPGNVDEAHNIPAIPGITREHLDIVSRLFISKGEEIIKQRHQELKLLGAPSYRAALKDAIFAKDPHASLGRSFRKIQDAAKPLIEQIDPGVVEDVTAKFAKSLKAAVRNCEEIRFRASIAKMDVPKAEMQNIKALSSRIVKELNSAQKLSTIKSLSDVSRVVSSVLPSTGKDMSYDDEFELSTHSAYEDEYSDLLESLEFDLPREDVQESTPLIDCITSALDSSEVLGRLLNGELISSTIEKDFCRELLHSYFISQSTKVDLKSRDASEEIKNILSHKSEDSNANFLAYRPSDWAQLHKHLEDFLKNASYSQGINSESYVALVGRLSPSLFEEFAKTLVDPGNVLLNLSEGDAEAVMLNLPTLVEYYKYVSERRRERGQPRETSLVCQVHLFKIHLESQK